MIALPRRYWDIYWGHLGRFCSWRRRDTQENISNLRQVRTAAVAGDLGAGGRLAEDGRHIVRAEWEARRKLAPW